MADNQIQKIIALLGDSTKKFASKIEETAKVFDKLSGDLGKALRSNIDPDKVAEKIGEVDIAATKLTAIFGQGREHIVAIKANLVDSVVQVTKLGGDFAAIVSMQEDIAKSTNRNLIVNSNLYEKLFATTKVTQKSTSELTTAFKDVGFSISHIEGEMQKVVDISRKLGVNAKDVSSDVIKNMDYMNRLNFQGGVEGMAKMAAQAQGLRISMKDTLMFAERVYNPENAIETAAALQRLGVTQSQLLDPLRLMDLSLNDPTELQNQIKEMTQQYVEMGEKGKFQIMPEGKLHLQEIAKAMQIPYDTLTKMALGGAELDKKMREIKFPEVDEDTKALIANMAEFDEESKEYKVSFQKDGELVTKSVASLNPEDIKALGEAAKPKDMTKLAEEQLDTQTRIKKAVESIANRTGYAYAATPVTEKFLAGQVEIFRTTIDNLSKKFDVKNLRQQLTKTGSGLLESMKTGDFDPMKKSMNEFQDYFKEGLLETVTEGWSKTKESLKKSTNEFVQFFARMDFDLEEILKKLQEVFPDIEDDGGGDAGPPETTDAGPPETTDAGPPSTTSSTTMKDYGPQPRTNKDNTKDNKTNSFDYLQKIFQNFKLPSLSENNQKSTDNLKLLPETPNFLDKFMNTDRPGRQDVVKFEGNPTIRVEINVNSPEYITKDEFSKYLEDKGVVDTIYNGVRELISNFGRTSELNILEKNKQLTNQQYSNTIS